MQKMLIAGAGLLLSTAQPFAQEASNPDYVSYPTPSLIERDLSGRGRTARRNYDKFISYQAPNGGRILLIATKDISDEQLLRAYNILSFYLTDVPGSRFGADKSAVANHMADNEATLVLPGGSDGNSPVSDWALIGQPLYEDEFPIEGSRAYMENDYDHRDAGFEEIFHLVHDMGIGTRFTKGALSDSSQVAFAKATEAAMTQKLWGASERARDWIEELRAEGSLQQEYAAAIIDSYYGLWGAWDEAPGGMWGEYVAKTREDTERLDPDGLALIRAFLPAYLTYMARIDPAFEGHFDMQFTPELPYTYKSQYLLNAALTGAHSSALSGNAQDNVLIGNSGDNTIDGRGGEDVVQYALPSHAVTLRREADAIIVSGTGIGEDRLYNIETLRFLDQNQPTAEIK